MSKKKENGTKQVYKQSEVDELFGLAETKEGIIILVGKYKVSSKTFKTYEDADNYISQKPYELIINISTLFNRLLNENKETEKADAEIMQNAKNN